MLASSVAKALVRSKTLARSTHVLVACRGFAGGNGGHHDSNSQHVAAYAGVIATTVAAAAVISANNETLCAPAKESKPVDKFANTAMYPPIAPYEKGMLKVSNVHTIAYSVYGNPKGKPVLVVHGGPGGGTTPDMARYFDPKVYRIVLVDQRGCGESTPFANLEDNTTYDSVRDFEKIRVKLGVERWQVFGGSWGSTLSLVYAMEHPKRVTELVIRGVFLLREEELKWMYQGRGANFLFPEDWADYVAAIPPAERGDFMKAYHRRLRGDLGEAEMYKAAKAWSVWEGRISKLIQDPAAALKHSDAQFALAFARIENHYFTNKGFFPRDGFLLEEENLAKIRHIPTVIVQGRYDVVCPPVSAYELHKGLPDSELIYTLTGHSAMETEIIEQLVKATEKYKNNKW